MTLELRLLLACARIRPGPQAEGAIGRMLAAGIDWTLFARKAIDHGLAGLAGHTLAGVAPDAVPPDILDAFRMNVEQTRDNNKVLFDELARMMDVLAKDGVEAIPFKGPVIALQAYGDLGLRVFRDLDFLIRDCDVDQTVATLRGLGYERKGQLSEAQIDAIRRLQGQDILFKKGAGIAVEPHTRLTPQRRALDIDYAGLWHRAQRTALNGRTMLTLAPEDHFLILAIHGGKELWWRISWACDIAAFIASHEKLDWNAILERARAQGCLRMVLLAAALARRHFAAALPDAVIAAELADPAIEPMAQRVMARWLADEPGGPPSNSRLSMDRLRLHDGVGRRARYALRTWLLPGPHHVGWVALPRRLSFAYVPLKIAHDVIMLPLWRAYSHGLAQAGRLKDALARYDLVLAMMPGSAELRLRLKQHKGARADANRALAADPNNVAAWHNLANALRGLKHHKQAITCYDKA